MTAMYVQSLVKHLEDEYWAYIALFGLVFLYTGIMVAVFGFTDIVKPETGGQIEGLGIFFVLSGLALLCTSGILYHRKQHRLRPCICCGVDMDDQPDIEVRSKKRLRFAPNLISPYYEQAVQQQILQSEGSELEGQGSRVVSVEIDDETDRNTTWVEEIRDPGTDNFIYADDNATLVTRDVNGTQITKC